MKRAATIPVTGLALDPQAPYALYRQLFDQLRDAILSGQLRVGTRLPSTRTLASELGISRHTILSAYDQLRAEGYIEGAVGAGTVVARVLPEALLHAPAEPLVDMTHTDGRHTTARVPHRERSDSHTSQRSTLLIHAVQAEIGFNRQLTATSCEEAPAFRIGTPALDLFPREVWARLVTRRIRSAPVSTLGYQDYAGYRPLRELIAAYLGVARGVRCTAEQVIVTLGAQEALHLAAHTLLDPGDAAWIEDPGYPGARGALLSADARLVPIPVDRDGLDVTTAIATCPEARLAYVTPSHQFPLGVAMSLHRKIALLEWANQKGMWVVEDDYDSEYRYVSKPLPALQGLASGGQVIYVGTFSKVLFPSLRLGYLVVPPTLIDIFIAARQVSGTHLPILEQAVLADFFAEGHFGRHVRRMRTIYAERGGLLTDALQRQLPAQLDVRKPDGGLHVVARLRGDLDDHTVQREAAQLGIEVYPVSGFRQRESVTAGVDRVQDGLALGFAGLQEHTLLSGVERLARIFNRVRRI